MSRKGGQPGGDVRPTPAESGEQDNVTAFQRVLDKNVEELRWVAEVMAGSRQAGEQCLAEAIELAEAAKYVGRDWMLPWVKRSLVHVLLKRLSSDMRQLLPPAGPRSAGILARAGMSTRDRQELRSIPPQRIIASFDLLERACFILHAYLEYPVLDCALLLGCPRGWIESICERFLNKIASVDQSSEDNCRNVGSFISRGVAECTG